MQYGGTVDKFLGDGAMFRFNVPHEISDWRMQAIRATLAMRSAFEVQKDVWRRAGMPVNALFTRIGVASGPVREAHHWAPTVPESHRDWRASRRCRQSLFRCAA